jgi:hypothetical protein
MRRDTSGTQTAACLPRLLCGRFTYYDVGAPIGGVLTGLVNAVAVQAAVGQHIGNLFNLCRPFSGGWGACSAAAGSDASWVLRSCCP